PPPPDLLAQLDAYGAEREAEEPAPAAVVVEANPDQLWSLVAEVVAGEGSDYKPLATLYQDFQLRARIQGLSRNVLELGSFNRMLATIRAGMDRERSESEDWKQAQAIAATLPEDVQGVFLLLARTALDGETCPGDEALARAYGTHSLGRARRQLNYLEEREVIVLQDTPLGRRVAIVGLGWQTA
ncbi:ATP-binding protein, partial [Gluconobacter sphaericus]|nr:ATP-binding protein [Gluconobacter sphaericus]